MTPRGHFTSLAQQCRNAAKRGDMKRLQAYLASPAFTAALNAQSEALRRIAIRVMSESLIQCDAGKRRPGPAPRRPIRWDAERKVRFRKLLFSVGLEEAAKALGITVPAAKLAAKRHVPDYVVPTTGYHEQAA